MKFGVVVFPGSNCDHDAYHALSNVLGQETVYLWHKEEDLQSCDVIILPGGFSYGDYLRCGAIARFSPVMDSIRKHADQGRLVLGICNGFQILQEIGLLPGVMLRNPRLKFLCKNVYLRVENTATSFTSECRPNQVLKIPIAHNEGSFYAPEADIKKLESENRVVFRYVDKLGQQTPASNLNGSVSAIAGIMNREGNVLGMMPHPERAVEELMGSTDGIFIFKSLIHSLTSVRA